MKAVSLLLAGLLVVAVGTVASARAETMVGLSHQCYQSEGPPGAATLRLDLAVNWPKHTVSGTAEVSQATNPPLRQEFSVQGDWFYMATMESTSLGVNFATPATDLLGAPHLSGRMVLDAEWQAGQVIYSYQVGSSFGSYGQSAKGVACQ